MTESWNAVTGATGYTGRYITRALLAQGERVKTMTGHPNRPNPFGDQVPVLPFDFDHPARLQEHLSGAKTLYNTYWVRFAHGQATFDLAIRHTQLLLEAAKAAGVKKVVHVSIANPDEQSPWPYYRGKAYLEREIIHSGLAYAILRPTVIFGTEDILINNIAWCLRRFPVFAVPGSGRYRIQPMYVEDMAQLALNVAQRDERVILDAVGPEIFSFDEFVRLIGNAVGSRARLLHASPQLALGLSRLVGLMVGDVVLTREELEGLMADLLVSTHAPTGHTRFSEWLTRHAATVGARYASELQRHYAQPRRV